VSNAYIAASRKSREARSLSEAERLLARAAEFTPNHADLVSERKLLSDARALQDKMAQQGKLAADTNALKQKLRDQTNADDPDFLVTYRDLKQILPATDSFLLYDAPKFIAESYMRLARKAARDGRFADAVGLMDKGFENASGLVTLRTMRAQYAKLLALSEQISTGATLSDRDFRTTLDALAKSDPALHADVVRRFQASLDARIRAERSRNPAVAATLEASAQQIFPDQARATVATRPAPAPSPVPAPAPSVPVPTPPPNAQSPGATVAGSSGPYSVEPAPVPGSAPGVSAKPCRVDYQRLGKRSQAVCYDSPAGGRGPDLVVLPAGGPFSSPVAVMRFEVTNEDYNLYCTSTNRCKSVSGGARLPIVAIGVSEAERYAAWLTEATGKTYRFPSNEEWTYVASEIPERAEFNCTVELGGQKIRGQALAERNTGTPTNWGVYNIVGNAREWTRSGTRWAARGGAFSDSMSSCSAALGSVHDGQPDGKTGFRLIREF
jgi:hypothetical protein